MADGISSVNYNSYNNELLTKSDLKAYKNLKSQLPEAEPDSVSFTGNKKGDFEADDSQEKPSKSNAGIYIVSAALLVGAFFTGKYLNKIKDFFTSKGAKDAVRDAVANVAETSRKAGAKAKDKLAKAKNSVTDLVETGKKKIKGTSVSGASEPVTEARALETASNINTQHVNANTRKVVQESTEKLVTPAEQAAYDASIAHQPLSPKQEAVKAKLDAKNAAQRERLNSVANNSQGSEKLNGVTRNAKKAERVAAKITDGAHVHPDNKNIYYTTNGEVTKIITAAPNSKGDYEIVDPLKIAKHLAKQNIDLAKFAA